MIENTDKLFITRKRKKWKFAHFNEWSNCFEIVQVSPEQWQQPLVVEIGAGTADLSVGLAKIQPQNNFVAVDVKADRLYTGAKFCLQNNLTNIAFVRAHAAQITNVFSAHTVNKLWITFPDPFPRNRQAKHRLTHPSFLKNYQQLLVPNGVVHFKTDNRQLFLWSLEQIIVQGWHITELSFDLHKSNLPEHYKITTYYERKFMAQDVPINFASFTPPAVTAPAC